MRPRLVVGKDGRIYVALKYRELPNNVFEVTEQCDVTADFHRIAKGRKK